MRRPLWLTTVAAMLVIAAAANGDTVFFKDGSSLDGRASQPNPNSVRIEFGDGNSMTFMASEVERIERNDKMPRGGLQRENPLAAQRQQELFERTGLTAEQRAEVRALLQELKSEASETRVNAHRKLVARGQDMNVFQFLEVSLPYLTKIYVPGVLQVLVDLDTERALPVLTDRAHDVVPESRGMALELLGRVQARDRLDVIARGMVDHDPVVQISAAKGFAHAGDKRATPVLLEGMKSNDRRVQNACQSALAAIWSTPERTVAFESPDEWRSYWAGHAGGVSNALSPAGVKPLIEPEPDEVATHHNE